MPRIGLALGGGAARGLAHIPMLEVFDELGIKPAVISGCSIGALVGAGYACGMSAAEVRGRAEQLLSNKIETMKYVFSTRQSKLTDIFSLKSLTALHLNGEKLVDLVLPDHLPQMIEDTVIPFRVIATDYEMMEERVFKSGPMVPAVAASIAIPSVINAPRIDGRIHVDGGVTNPVPFDHAREGADIVVAVDVTGRPRTPGGRHPGNMELGIGSILIMFAKMAELRRAISSPEIYIKPPVESFGTGDFFRAREIFAAAEPAKDELKRLLSAAIDKFREYP